MPVANPRESLSPKNRTVKKQDKILECRNSVARSLALNEVPLSKGPKPEFQRAKEGCRGLERVGHLQLEAEN